MYRSGSDTGFYDKCILATTILFAPYWERQHNLATTQMSLPQRDGVFSVRDKNCCDKIKIKIAIMLLKWLVNTCIRNCVRKILEEWYYLKFLNFCQFFAAAFFISQPYFHSRFIFLVYKEYPRFLPIFIFRSKCFWKIVTFMTCFADKLIFFSIYDK